MNQEQIVQEITHLAVAYHVGVCPPKWTMAPGRSPLL